MKLYEWYAKNFIEYGDIVAVKHPYFNKSIQVNSVCLFHKHCGQTESVLCMSSRKGDVQFSVCTGCLQNYFTSWAQDDEQTLEYHFYASGVDLREEFTE